MIKLLVFLHNVYTGDPEVGEVETHPDGIHIYDFEVPLNDNLPSSLEGAYGFVR